MLALFTDFVTNQIVQYGYLAIFVLMLLESACIPIPCEVTMLFGGALASAGFVGGGTGAQPLLGGASRARPATSSGRGSPTGVGCAGGRPLVDRFGRYLLIRPHEVDRAHVWFERHGDAAVFFSRLIPVVRTFISVPAGVARMNFAKFTLYTILGCLAVDARPRVDRLRLGDNWAARGAGDPSGRLGDRRGDPARAASWWVTRDGGVRCARSTRRSTGRERRAATVDRPERRCTAQRFTTIVQDPPSSSPTFSNPTR